MQPARPTLLGPASAVNHSQWPVAECRGTGVDRAQHDADSQVTADRRHWQVVRRLVLCPFGLELNRIRQHASRLATLRVGQLVGEKRREEKQTEARGRGRGELDVRKPCYPQGVLPASWFQKDS